MKFDPIALEAAVAQHLSADYAPAIGAHLVALAASSTEGLAAAELGELLLRVVSGWNGKADPTLAAVSLIAQGTTVTFDPEDALANPLLRDWLPPSLSAAVAAPVVAGALLLPIAHDAPSFGQVELIEAGGGMTGRFWLRFASTQVGEAQVCCHYGAPGAAAPLLTVRRLNGQALVAIGAQLRLAPNEAPLVAGPGQEGAALALWSTASSMIH